jgi:hypothetical protein
MAPDDVVAMIERDARPEAKSGALGSLRGIESFKRNGDTDDTVDAIGPKVGGFVKNVNGELADGMAASESWLEA